MTELKDCIHYYLGCEVEYEGIVNGKELKAEMEANKHDVFYLPKVEKVIGKKTGFIKRIDQLVDGTRRYRIGRRGLQTHYNTKKFKLILRRLSDMTEEEMKECGNLDYDFSGTELDVWEWNSFNTLLSAKQFDWLIKKDFWLFGDEAFDNGIIIDAKTLAV